jgi:VRR-NUC domain
LAENPLVKELSEHNIQSAFIEWCRLKANSDQRLQNVIAIPNAGLRSWKYGKRLKAEGLSAGFPDIFVFIPSRGYMGLALEFKSKKGKLRPNQKEWLDRLKSAGYAALVVRSLDEAIQALELYMK